MTAASATAGAPTASIAATSSTMAMKVVRSTVRSRQLMTIITVQGVLFLLIFRYVFGGAIDTGRLRYVDYMVPGIVTVGILFATSRAAVGAAQERASGFLERVRSLPASLAGVMVGRVLAEGGIGVYAIGVNSAVAFAVGFRLHGDGLVRGLAAFGVLAATALAFAALFTALGYRMSSPEAASGLGFLALPFSFFSSAFVPVSTMPGWLQPVARNQPVTTVIDAVRTITQGAPAEALVGHSGGYVAVRALAWVAVLAIVGTWAGARALRHAGAR